MVLLIIVFYLFTFVAKQMRLFFATPLAHSLLFISRIFASIAKFKGFVLIVMLVLVYMPAMPWHMNVSVFTLVLIYLAHRVINTYAVNLFPCIVFF